MKNVTKHFMRRWAERVIGLKDKDEVNQYVTKNKDMIAEHANKTFEHADYIYTGSVGDNMTRNYHVKDNYLFVTNTTDDAFITICNINLGLTEELNVTVRKGLIEEIKRLHEEKEEIDFNLLVEVENKEAEIESANEQIKVLEEKLRIAKEENNFRKEEIKNIKKKSLGIGLDIRQYVLLLVNSKDYQGDLSEMK